VTVLSEADKVLKEIEEKAETEFLPIVGPERGKVLAEEVKKAKPKRVLEVGTLIGYSAILMGREMGKRTEIVSIENHAEEAKAAEENIRRAKIPAKVEVLTGDAIQVIPTLKGSFDLVFIDADKTEYSGYLRLVEGKLRKGSVVVADNVGMFAGQMKDFLDYVRSSGKYRSRFVQVGEDGLEISVKL
jgi:predicted O-methyltransferase YrrM